jgi:hypothetical protein
VNAYHQNLCVEKIIREFPHLVKASLLHAEYLWANAVNSYLWPYTIRKAPMDQNSIKSVIMELSPIQIWSGSKINYNAKHFHTFGCPMYTIKIDQLAEIQICL